MGYIEKRNGRYRAAPSRSAGTATKRDVHPKGRCRAVSCAKSRSRSSAVGGSIRAVPRPHSPRGRRSSSRCPGGSRRRRRTCWRRARSTVTIACCVECCRWRSRRSASLRTRATEWPPPRVPKRETSGGGAVAAQGTEDAGRDSVDHDFAGDDRRPRRACGALLGEWLRRPCVHQQGRRPAHLVERMGHSSIKVTLDRYGHLFPSSTKPSRLRLVTGWLRLGSAAPRA